MCEYLTVVGLRVRSQTRLRQDQRALQTFSPVCLYSLHSEVP